jgi:hypothetical protein
LEKPLQMVLGLKMKTKLKTELALVVDPIGD